MNVETVSQKEIKPPLDSETAFFILGATSRLIDRVKNSNNPNDLTDLKVYLSALTLPPSTRLEDYLSDLGKNDYVQTIRDERTQSGVFFEGLFYALRNREDIHWFDYEDPLLRETMISDTRKLDSDTNCMVTYRLGQYNIKWILPKPEAYWQCKDPDKLIHVAMIALEEMFHLSQIQGNKVTLHSFGVEYNLTDDKHNDLSHYVTKMMEVDVSNILTTAMPEMIEENWQWYAVRKAKRPHEDHYPLSTDIGFLFGYLIARAMKQEREFIAGAMTHMPKFLDRNPDEREIFFSNYQVKNIIESYLSSVYEPDVKLDITAEHMNAVLKHEFSRDGITMQFLLTCLLLKEKHGNRWLEILDKRDDESEDQGVKYGTNIVNMILDFVNTNPKWFNELRGKKSIGPNVFKRGFKNPDHMLEVLSRSYK